MSDQPQKPLKGKELSELYPKAKTYDEVRGERDAAAKMRRNRLPKYPSLLAIGILAGLSIAIYLIITYMTPVIATQPFFGVPATIFLGIVWLYGVVVGLRKINAMRDQIHN